MSSFLILKDFHRYSVQSGKNWPSDDDRYLRTQSQYFKQVSLLYFRFQSNFLLSINYFSFILILSQGVLGFWGFGVLVDKLAQRVL